MSETEMMAYYQNCMRRLIYPEEKKVQLKNDMVELSLQQTPTKKMYFRTVVRVAALMCVVFVLAGSMTLRALEKARAKGVTIRWVERAGIEYGKLSCAMRLWNQHDVPEVDGKNLALWQEWVPEAYEKLEEMQIENALLPSYGLGEYQCSDMLFTSNEKEITLAVYMSKGDSNYVVWIEQFPQCTETVFAGKFKWYDEQEVNGLIYEIMQVDSNYRYEEYYEVQKELLKGFQEPFDEEWFDDWKKRPVHIMVRQDGWSHHYALSEDIDVMEFLESIR